MQNLPLALATPNWECRLYYCTMFKFVHGSLEFPLGILNNTDTPFLLLHRPFACTRYIASLIVYYQFQISCMTTLALLYPSSADWQYIFIEGKQTDGQKTKTTTTKYYSLQSAGFILWYLTLIPSRFSQRIVECDEILIHVSPRYTVLVWVTCTLWGKCGYAGMVVM